MTDQSNTPKPPQRTSLFERAGDAFGLKGFRPAPVPETLESARTVRARQTRPVQARPPVEPAPIPVELPPMQQAQPAVTQEPPAVVPAPEPVEAVRFNAAPRTVDRKLLREQGYIVPDAGVTGLFEEFRIVKRRLLQGARDSLAGRAPRNGQRVLVCSPLPGEGKTFCAINLALAMAAEMGSEVVLVDADLGKPSIPGILGLGDGSDKGLMDALADPAIKVENCVIPTDIPGLFVLPAGIRTTADSEYLSNSRTPAVLDRLTQGAPNRMVIFDSPPALAASPAAELARHVGQIVLVVRADKTGQSALEDAVELLSTGADIKLLLNDARFSPSGRRFGSYYYGEGAQ